jgi:phosphoglucomutase
VLAWLQILAGLNAKSEKLIGVEDVLKQLWSKYGRNYYKRFDYENIPDEIGNKVWARIEGEILKNAQKYVIL